MARSNPEKDKEVPSHGVERKTKTRQEGIFKDGGEPRYVCAGIDRGPGNSQGINLGYAEPFPEKRQVLVPQGAEDPPARELRLGSA